MSFEPDYKTARVVPSPNHDARTSRIDILMLHYTGMQTGDEALARLTTRGRKFPRTTSSTKTAASTSLCRSRAAPGMPAWASWKGAIDINARSIGIEIVNPGHENGYPRLSRRADRCRDRAVPRHHPAAQDLDVIACSRIRTSRRPRKIDPGEKFPWARLAAAGIGRFDPAPLTDGETLAANDRGPDVLDLQKKLVRLGFALERTGVYDDATKIVVSAFQRHFRPERVDGLADISTRETLARLLIRKKPALTLRVPHS